MPPSLTTCSPSCAMAISRAVGRHGKLLGANGSRRDRPRYRSPPRPASVAAHRRVQLLSSSKIPAISLEGCSSSFRCASSPVATVFMLTTHRATGSKSLCPLPRLHQPARPTSLARLADSTTAASIRPSHPLVAGPAPSHPHRSPLLDLGLLPFPLLPLPPHKPFPVTHTVRVVEHCILVTSFSVRLTCKTPFQTFL